MKLKYKLPRFFVSIWDFFRYDILYGVENLIKWFPIIWNDRDWDHVYLLRIMEKKMRQMAHLQEKYGITLSRFKKAKQLRICAHFVQKNAENAKFYGYPGKAWAKEWDAVQKQDRELLGKIIGRRIDSWWD